MRKIYKIRNEHIRDVCDMNKGMNEIMSIYIKMVMSRGTDGWKSAGEANV